MRLLEHHQVPDTLLKDCKDWLFKKSGSSVSRTSYQGQKTVAEKIGDGDASGGGKHKPQPPSTKKSTAESQASSPKLKQVKSEKRNSKERRASPPTQKGDEDAEDGSDEMMGSDSESSGDDTKDPHKLDAIRRLSASREGPSGAPNPAKEKEDKDFIKRKTGVTADTRRQRRFTVALTSSVLPPPPQEQCLQLISEVQFFKEFSMEDRKRIADVVRCAKYEPGEIISNCGMVGEAIHIIVEGEAKVCEPREISVLRGGEFFGDEAIQFSGALSPYQVSASAGGPLTTISITKTAFQSLKLQPPLHKKKEHMKTTKKTDSDNQNAGICEATGRPKLEYTKTPADKNLIREALQNNKVLAEVLALSEEQHELVFSMVHMVSLEKGEVLMTKGDQGNCLYIVADGLLDVHLSGKVKSSTDIKITPGDSFGEIALLYDTPRAATITAHFASKLWILVRKDFKKVLSSRYESRTEQYCKMLLKIPSITQLADASSIDMIANVLEEVSFLDGEEICIEGEDAGTLSIILSGEADMMRNGSVVGHMKEGDWVGEESLMMNTPADCTVKVSTDEAVVLVLNDSNLKVVVKAIQELKSQQGSEDRGAVADAVLKNNMVQSSEADADDSQHHLKHLRKIGVLGEGSFGLVLLMENTNTGKRYAIKGLLKQRMKDEDMLQSVSSERQLQLLMDSNFITRLYASYHDDMFVYFVQEPVMGGELFDVYNEQNFFGNLKFARFYIACVTLGLAHMHSKRVIYRDLKLENCLLDVSGYVKLTDLGISKLVVGKTYTVCGTADYFAPETLKQSGHNRAVDWWACGVLLFLMCSGRSPFDAPDVTQIYKNIIKGFSKVKFPETFPSDIIDVVKSLCRKQPEERITMQKGGVENLKQMPYFTNLDWDDLEEGKIAPPYKPDIPSDDVFAKKQLSRPVDIDVDSLRIWDGQPW
eukprot:TRINITY_DN19912_c0_g1_i2.p1 TRINITY_DN19912_c0_g1~~TRINITY_DN19912_c0_g1_i2.p1  ORF type:complete len:1012 (-),score=210.91 TRINITY_DN19912_c0_g1_i2:25-2826(-)